MCSLSMSALLQGMLTPNVEMPWIRTDENSETDPANDPGDDAVSSPGAGAIQENTAQNCRLDGVCGQFALCKSP